MVEIRSAIVLSSDLNCWMSICITVGPYEDFEAIKEIATKAYDDWFEDEESDETIGEYLKRKLAEKGHEPEIFFGNFESDTDNYDF